MSRWLFDLGNSRLKCAQWRGDGSLGDVLALEHDGQALADGWQAQLPARIDAAFVASVAAPGLRTQVLDALAARSGRICVAGTQRVLGGVRIAYDEPAKLGVDRFLTLLAAHARGGAWLVVGVGTALTIDLVDADGRHHGGRIAPSPTLMREALHGRARQLLPTGGQYREFAADTGDALASGCVGAALALVERSLRAACDACGNEVSLLLHGGGAAALAPMLEDASIEPALVLHGLACWAQPASRGR